MQKYGDAFSKSSSIVAFFLLEAFIHVCRLLLYDIRSSHIVKETSACVCHLYKGNSEYADTFTTAQADLSLSGRLGVCSATIYIKHPSPL